MIDIFAINQIIYKILGASRSTKLAYALLGKVIADKSNKEKIFNAKYGIKLKLTPREAIQLGIYHLGAVHLLETLVVKDILSLGDVVIDIGAYKDGWYSLLAAQIVGKKGHVYSFEPHPLFFQKLKENIKLNGYKNIKAEKLAISDKKGTMLLYEAGSSSSFFEDHITEDLTSSKPISIKTITLDNYIRQKKINHIRFIKIDVEGAELKVLKGAKKLLSSKTSPDLMIEIIDKNLNSGGSNRKEVIKLLQHYGYLKPFIFTHDGLKSYSAEKQITPNLFFTKNKITYSHYLL